MMQDSDDYFTDDIVFDDQALAVLDEVEHKFAQSSRISQKPPPTKRQKTVHGWKAGGSTVDSLNDLEDLPEISIQEDGTYGLRADNGAARRSGIVNSHPASVTGATRLEHSGHTLNVSAVPPARGAPYIPARTSGRAPSSHGHPPTPSSQNRPYQFEGPTSLRNVSVPPGSQPLPQTHPSAGVQVEELRKQMEELHKDNLKVKAALQEALDVKLAKEGEVSILRKTIQKTAQDHAAQVAKLRTAKEEADAKQAQVRREMKEEVERLRTQFTFKQHEIETSVRKPPWSVRSRKIAKDVPSTPFPISSQMHGWNLDGAGPSKFGSETPRRPHAVSPKARRGRRSEAPETVKKSGTLPGFQNAFMPSSPILSSQVRREKAKEREEMHQDQTRKAKGKERASLPYPSQFASGAPPPISPPSSPTLQRGRASEADVNMQDISFEGEGDEYTFGDVETMDGESDVPFLDSHEGLELVSWKEELPRIILTHSLPSTPSLTIQTLMTATLPSSLPASSIDTYTSACSRVLEIIAATSKYQDWEENIDRLASALITMAQILNVAHLIHPLTALLNLLILLIFSLPSFSASLLRSHEEDPNQQSPPLIIILWCDIVQDQLVPGKPSDETREALMSLGQETIGLLETLCWNIPDEFVEKLGFLLRIPRVLSILLHSSQPPWLLNRSTRLLVILASHSSLFRQLLAFPDSETPREKPTDKDFSRIPHVEAMCSYLVDVARKGEEAESMRIHILMFIAMISISHVDALTILLESQTLIPSLVLFLFYLTTSLWEDDETLMASPTLMASSIRTVNQTVFLLHHLVFGLVPVFNLRHKLHCAPHRQFNGMTHMFIVAFGRLSYADPPDWVDRNGRLELGRIAEMARDLLDLVVEGPECDSVWAVYREAADQKSDTDDEEMEARNLHTNEI